MWGTEQIVKADLKPVSSSKSSTLGVRFISLSATPLASACFFMEMSAPIPAASIFVTPAKASIATRANGHFEMALSSLSEFPNAIRPVQRKIVNSPKLWTVTLNISGSFCRAKSLNIT